MKKILHYGSMAALLILLASCSKDDTEPAVPSVRTITRTFPVDETVYTAQDTRTAYENGEIGFTDTEYLGAYVWDDNGKGVTGVKRAERTPGTGGSPATITVSHDAVSTSAYHYVFVSPYKYIHSLGTTTQTVTLSTVQHPTPETFDPAQDILVSKPVTGPADASTSPALETVVFKRLFTFFRLTIDGSKLTDEFALAEGEKIQSVTLTAPEGTALTGTAKVTIDEAYDQTTFNISEPSNTVTADYGTDGQTLAENKLDVWFVVNPVSFNGLTIEIKTSAKTITQNLENITFNFKANGINSLTFQPASTANITTTPTPAVTDYYTGGVEINGVTYSKDSSSKSKQQTANSAKTDIAYDSGVTAYFLDDANNAEYSFNFSSIKYFQNTTVIIGSNANYKTKLILTNPIHLRGREGVTIAFKNLKIDATDSNSNYSYVFTLSDNKEGTVKGGIQYFIFEDCDITFGNGKNLFAPYSSTTEDSYIENIIFRNCRLRYEPGTKTSYYALIKLTDHLKSGLSSFRTLIFENNVFYSCMGDNPTSAFSIFVQDHQETPTGTLSNLSITCRNNTFLDLISYGFGADNPAGMGSAYFQVDQIGSVEFTGNLLYSEAAKYVSIMRVTYDYKTNGPWPNINLDRGGNAAYGTNGWKLYYNDDTKTPTPYYPEGITNTYPQKQNDPDSNEDRPLSVYDPANGIFKTTTACDGYGSTLLY